MDLIRRLLRLFVVGLLFLCVAASVAILAAAKFKPLGKRILAAEERQKGILNGDLYSLSYLERFKEAMRETKLKETFPCLEKPIVIMGDSFFNTGFDSDPVPNALEHRLGKNICYRATSRNELPPDEYVAMMGRTEGSGQGIFIWETIERKSLGRALALTHTDAGGNPRTNIKGEDMWTVIRHAVFDRVDVEYMIKNNRFTRPINVWLRNAAFNWFGDTNGKTPLYTHNPPMLFMDEEVAFHQNAEKLKLIDTAADAIAHEARILKEQSNLTLLYVLIPDKFSIYGDLAGAHSDAYASRLLDALNARNVATIDLGRIYAEERRIHPDALLYYSGDTHYTPRGKQLLIDEILKTLDPLPGDTHNAKRDT